MNDTDPQEPRTVQETMKMLADSDSWLPHHGFKQEGDETVTLELTRANAFRVSQAVALAAHHILQQDEEETEVAARQGMALSQEIKRQLREARHTGGEE